MLVAAAVRIVYATSPSSTKSLTPVTVTVCGVAQLAVVNVRLDAETVPSPVFELLTGIVTLALGWLLSTTVNDAVPPASVVVRPEAGLTVIPGVGHFPHVEAQARVVAALRPFLAPAGAGTEEK